MINSRVGRRLAIGVVSGLLAGSPAVAGSTAQQERANVPYVEEATPKQHLDLYRPEAPGHPAPLLLLVHGGSLTSGDRRESPWPGVCRAFAAEGLACAAASYRLFPRVDWPAPAEDIAAALAWLHEHAGTHDASAHRRVREPPLHGGAA